MKNTMIQKWFTILIAGSALFLLTLGEDTENKMITSIFFYQFQKGLKSGEDHFESSVKCFPTYVRSLPNGKERGKFLSLDLGGTNFRVIVMELTEESEFIMDNKVYAIPQDIMIGKKF